MKITSLVDGTNLDPNISSVAFERLAVWSALCKIGHDGAGMG
jgi:hypothetical protein